MKAVIGVVLAALAYGLYVLAARKRQRARAHALYSTQRVWVTGASSGIGQSVAMKLAAHGSRLVLSARSSPRLEKVAEDCRRAGAVDVVVVPMDMDVRDAESIRAMAERFTDVAILISCAGISSRSAAEDSSLAVDEQLMRVNFFSHVALAKGLLPSMLRIASERRRAAAGGFGGSPCRLAFVSSVQGLVGIPFRTSYAASKHALQGFCDSLRAEVSGRGVGVTVISPGYVRTALSDNAVTGDGSKYGKTDVTTAQGMDPDVLAEQILDAVARSEPQLVVAQMSAHVAVALRWIAPSLLAKILAKRYQKQILTEKSH